MSSKCLAISVNLEEMTALRFKATVAITFTCIVSIAGEINRLSKPVMVKPDVPTVEKFGTRLKGIELDLKNEVMISL